MKILTLEQTDAREVKIVASAITAVAKIEISETHSVLDVHCVVTSYNVTDTHEVIKDTYDALIAELKSL
jgi:hypothetical protein